MARQNTAVGQTGQQLIDALNSNFTELYAGLAAVVADMITSIKLYEELSELQSDLEEAINAGDEALQQQLTIAIEAKQEQIQELDEEIIKTNTVLQQTTPRSLRAGHFLSDDFSGGDDSWTIVPLSWFNGTPTLADFAASKTWVTDYQGSMGIYVAPVDGAPEPSVWVLTRIASGKGGGTALTFVTTHAFTNTAIGATDTVLFSTLTPTTPAPMVGDLIINADNTIKAQVTAVTATAATVMIVPISGGDIILDGEENTIPAFDGDGSLQETPLSIYRVLDENYEPTDTWRMEFDLTERQVEMLALNKDEINDDVPQHERTLYARLAFGDRANLVVDRAANLRLTSWNGADHRIRIDYGSQELLHLTGGLPDEQQLQGNSNFVDGFDQSMPMPQRPNPNFDPNLPIDEDNQEFLPRTGGAHLIIGHNAHVILYNSFTFVGEHGATAIFRGSGRLEVIDSANVSIRGGTRIDLSDGTFIRGRQGGSLIIGGETEDDGNGNFVEPPDVQGVGARIINNAQLRMQGGGRIQAGHDSVDVNNSANAPFMGVSHGGRIQARDGGSLDIYHGASVRIGQNARIVIDNVGSGNNNATESGIDMSVTTYNRDDPEPDNVAVLRVIEDGRIDVRNGARFNMGGMANVNMRDGAILDMSGSVNVNAYADGNNGRMTINGREIAFKDDLISLLGTKIPISVANEATLKLDYANTGALPSSVTVNDFVFLQNAEVWSIQSIASNGDVIWQLVATFETDISGKMDLVSGASNGNVVTLNAQGQAIDSGMNLENEIRNGITRPNILRNRDFRNPVNQRGRTSYTGVSINMIDGWRNGSAGGTITLTGDGIALSSGLTFLQRIENPHLYAGETMTLSVIYRSDAPISLAYWFSDENNAVQFVSQQFPASAEFTTAVMTFTQPNVATDPVFWVGIGGGVPATRTIQRAKLELGMTSTLHLDPPADHAVELPKAKRSLYVLQPFTFFNIWIHDDGRLFFRFDLPVELRANPSSISLLNGNATGSITLQIAGQRIILNMEETPLTFSNTTTTRQMGQVTLPASVHGRPERLVFGQAFVTNNSFVISAEL